MKKIILLLFTISFFAANSMAQKKLVDHCVCAKLIKVMYENQLTDTTDRSIIAQYWNCDEVYTTDITLILEDCVTAWSVEAQADPDSIIFPEAWTPQLRLDIHDYAYADDLYLSPNCFNSLGCGPPCTNTTSTLSVTACTEYTSPSGKYTWITSATYMDTITNSAGCDSIITINLTIDVPNVSVMQSGAILKAITSAVNPTYKWVDCTNNFLPLPGQTSQTFTATADGSYAVIVTESICSDTSLCYNVTGLGLKKSNASELSVYPNPTKNNLTIQLTGIIENVRIYDLQGNELFYEKYDNASETVSVSLNGIATGIYICRVQSDTGVGVQKFTVVK